MEIIKDRGDIRRLVYAFYEKVRKDEILGPIFNMHLSEEQWSPHLEKLTDFWETNLLGIPNFKGNPMRAHAEVDRNLNYGITQDHFSHWVELWHETVDEMFEGEKAYKAKVAAKRMSMGLYMAIWNGRPENN